MSATTACSTYCDLGHASEIRNRLCVYPAHELKKNDILRVATASDAAARLSEMDAVTRQRGQEVTEMSASLPDGPSADAIFNHMFSYMELVTV